LASVRTNLEDFIPLVNKNPSFTFFVDEGRERS